ncbi:MAG: B-4DMT family transporter [Tomitella sp.]|nr:B-4DMT family transporter [Tomitella sp.]
MFSWGLRSIVMTVVHVVGRVVVGMAVTTAPLHGSAARYTGVAIVLLIALGWAGLDGVVDARRHPLVEDRVDLIGRWIAVGVITGLVAGAICHILESAGVNGLGANSWLFDLTSGAAGTALLIILPAAIGIGLGRWIGKTGPDPDDEANKQRQRRHDIALSGVGGDEE